jgi:hypothetical protein
LQASECLPETLWRVLPQTPSISATEFNGDVLHLENGIVMQVWVSPMGNSSRSKGIIIILSPFKAY